MKTERNLVEGQVDIFEAMNRAAAAVDQMVAEEKKPKPKTKKIPDNNVQKERHTAEGEKRPTRGENRAHGTLEIIRGCDMHASMQRTFLNTIDGDFAMVAYIDYNMVYLRDWNAPASLRKFADSKEAVEYYMTQLGRIRDAKNVEMAKENEPFSDVKYVVENIYAECE